MNLSKKRCEGLLIVAMIPFAVAALNKIDWTVLSPFGGQERNCVIYHQHAEPAHKCETTWTQD